MHRINVKVINFSCVFAKKMPLFHSFLQPNNKSLTTIPHVPKFGLVESYEICRVDVRLLPFFSMSIWKNEVLNTFLKGVVWI